MGRKPKYATLAQYQPYIDVIRKDLNIPDTYDVDVIFKTFSGASAGSASNKGTYAVIELDKRYSKSWTIAALMHEFMHVQQYVTNRLTNVYKPAKYSNGKKKRNTGKWFYQWDNKLYTQYGASRSSYKNNKYWNQPWEIEAREYEKEIDRLFPNLEIPNRIHIGTTSDGTKFYKMKG